ncbi:MAG: hypothetical protein QOF60_153 [Actinomycetota bacterium]|jgi:hypothetical protein|nr:hypothetical protein [Actinomycetota bacterium]
MKPLDLVTVAVLLFFGSRMFVSFRHSITRDGQAATVPIVKGLRPRHFLPVPLVLAAVVGAAVVLTRIPPLAFGWWTAIGGQGNPAFGVTDRTAGTPLEIVIPIVFVLMLIPALPLLVQREEQVFRLGAEEWPWPKRIGMVVLFGLVHALVGIPIGVAIALSIGGAYFMAAYLRMYRRTGSRREALLESTRRHLAYNATIVAVVVVVLALDAVLRLAGAA